MAEVSGNMGLMRVSRIIFVIRPDSERQPVEIHHTVHKLDIALRVSHGTPSTLTDTNTYLPLLTKN